jgi:integrase
VGRSCIGGRSAGGGWALAHLRETSRKGLIKCYGRWLEWLYRTEPGVLASPPVSRATVERLRAWIAQLAPVAPPTRLTLVNGALQVLREAHPEQDWRLPLRLLQPLRSEVENWQSNRKEGRIFSGAVVLEAAIELCVPKAKAASTPLKAAIMRRDGTMIAFLAMVPIRLRALCELTLGQSVLVSPSQIKVSLSEDMTKNGLPWEALVPQPLEGMLRCYLSETRTWLMVRTGARHDCLWVTRFGSPLAYGQIKNRIPEVTGRELGIKVSPHLFRDIAVTTLVRESPEDARLSRPLLGHASYGIVERHYNQAKGIEAGRDYAAVLDELRGSD